MLACPDSDAAIAFVNELAKVFGVSEVSKEMARNVFEVIEKYDGSAPAHGTEAARVAAKFVNEVRERGLRHVFSWLDAAVMEFADAQISDELKSSFGALAMHPKVRTFYVRRYLAQEAWMISSQSSSQGANMLQRAHIAALGKLGRDTLPNQVELDALRSEIAALQAASAQPKAEA